MEDTFNNRLQENLLRTPVAKEKPLAEERAIDSPEPYSKEVKIKEFQDYFKKAQECMAVLAQEVGESKSLEELQAKRLIIKAIYQDMQSALCLSLDSVIYGY